MTLQTIIDFSLKLPSKLANPAWMGSNNKLQGAYLANLGTRVAEII